MKLIGSIRVAIVLLASLCCLVAAEMDSDSCLKLCNDPNGNWQTARQVFECYNRSELHYAMGDLSRVLEDSKKQSNCNDNYKITLIEHFNHSMYQGVYPQVFKRPSSLKRAFIAYGLRLSASCRNDMVRVVSSQLDEILKEEDFGALARWTGDKSLVAKLFALDGKNNGLALPSPMVKLVKGLDKLRNVNVAVPVNTSFLRVQAVCQRRFKPIYKKIIDPLIRLAKKGFNYEPTTASASAFHDKTVERVQRWYRAVFVCKLLDNVNVREDPSIKAGHLRIANQVGFHSPKVSSMEYPEIKKVKFNYELIDERQKSGDDQLVDLKESQLMKAIKDFHEPSSNFGMKASLKMAGSSLAEKMSNTFRDDKADDNDHEIGLFLVDYIKLIDSPPNQLQREPKTTPKPVTRQPRLVYVKTVDVYAVQH